jgi:NAD(P)-dependent dehydrogenase (short-subunit alcohol dehydrogenase family)
MIVESATLAQTSLYDLVKLDGRCGIVTGAASGIGYAIARRLTEMGCSVVIADVDETGGRRALESLQEQGASAAFETCDVRTRSNLEDVASAALKLFGGLDIWINNAGIYPYADPLNTPEEVWNATLDTNLKGCFLGAAVAGAEMSRRGGGVILNIASIDAMRPTSGRLIHYQASKHGVVGLTLGLAKELGPRGVRVLAVAPGGVDSEGNAAAREPGETVVDAKMVPLRRRAAPDDVARTVALLVSDACSYVTGCVVPIEGGWLVG